MSLIDLRKKKTVFTKTVKNTKNATNAEIDSRIDSTK